MRNNVSDGRKGKGFKVFETMQRNNPKAMDTMASIYWLLIMTELLAFLMHYWKGNWGVRDKINSAMSQS